MRACYSHVKNLPPRHYNAPYSDVYMDIEEPLRGRGFGPYLVQELKRQADDIGAIPAAPSPGQPSLAQNASEGRLRSLRPH